MFAIEIIGGVNVYSSGEGKKVATLKNQDIRDLNLIQRIKNSLINLIVKLGIDFFGSGLQSIPIRNRDIAHRPVAEIRPQRKVIFVTQAVFGALRRT